MSSGGPWALDCAVRQSRSVRSRPRPPTVGGPGRRSPAIQQSLGETHHRSGVWGIKCIARWSDSPDGRSEYPNRKGVIRAGSRPWGAQSRSDKPATCSTHRCLKASGLVRHVTSPEPRRSARPPARPGSLPPAALDPFIQEPPRMRAVVNRGAAPPSHTPP